MHRQRVALNEWQSGLTVPVGLLAALGLAACVTRPDASSTLPAGARELEFRGLVSYRRGVNVAIKVRGTDGSFTTIATTPAASNGNWAVTVPLADDYFHGFCQRAVFQAVADPGGEVLEVADQECLNALPRRPTNEQILACALDTLVVERPRSSVFKGDLAIVGPEQAEEYQCLTAVSGNLSIDGSATLVGPNVYQDHVEVALPRLADVAGALTVHGNRASVIALPSLTHVGRDSRITLADFITDDARGPYRVTRLDAPRLAALGGNVALFSERDPGIPGSGPTTYDFGLSALTTLEHDLRIHNRRGLGAVLGGLNSLSEVRGNVLVEFGPSDLYTDSLLRSLTHIGGDLEVELNNRVRSLLPGVQHVDGSVTIRPEPAAGLTEIQTVTLSGLTQVGTLILDSVDARETCDAWFPRLTSLGRLRVTGGDAGLIGATGASRLSLSGVQIAGTLARLPLHADVALSPAAPVEITDSANLCQCQIDDFLARQRATGWTGTATTAGNGSAASCSPCPASSCL